MGELPAPLGRYRREAALAVTGTVGEVVMEVFLPFIMAYIIDRGVEAGADGFIRRLPDGYRTVVSGDGAGLSQGQCQLLAIARAAVADPPALILDEATSSIDTRTEEVVQRGMDALMAGRTTFVIAHRGRRAAPRCRGQPSRRRLAASWTASPAAATPQSAR